MKKFCFSFFSKKNEKEKEKRNPQRRPPSVCAHTPRAVGVVEAFSRFGRTHLLNDARMHPCARMPHSLVLAGWCSQGARTRRQANGTLFRPLSLSLPPSLRPSLRPSSLRPSLPLPHPPSLPPSRLPPFLPRSLSPHTHTHAHSETWVGQGWRRKLEDSLGCIKGEDSLPCHKRISVWMLVWEWGEADAQRWEGWQECQVSQMPLTSCPPPPPSRRRLWRTLACSACGCLAVLVPSLSSPPCRMPSPHPGTRSRPSGMRCWVCSASPAAFAHPLAHAPQRVKEEEEEGGGHKRRSSQVLEEGKKKGEEGCRHDASPAWATSPARRQAVLQPQPSAAQGSQASGALSQAAATDEHEGQGTRNAASSHDAMWTRNAASSDDAPTSPPPTSSPRQGGASSWTAAARVEASGREEGDAHQDGSNGACSATGRRRRRSAETPVQTAADACKNKNCHYCEHAPKRSAFFACLHPSCDQTFCENCNSRHLDAPTYFGGQDDASRANWLCPICTRCVQPPPPSSLTLNPKPQALNPPSTVLAVAPCTRASWGAWASSDASYPRPAPPHAYHAARAGARVRALSLSLSDTCFIPLLQDVLLYKGNM